MNTRDLFSENILLENDQILLRPSKLDDLDALIANEKIWLHSSADMRNKTDMQLYLTKV
jgi:hypothetical protein